ncbi:MAG: hypothetical protein K6A77_03965 [Clostridiales bacterium]|nr:hypothetical protein [Clostridiales bacterium]
MKRRIIALVLLVAALIALVGCSGGGGATGTYKLTKFMGMEIEQANSLYGLGGGEGSLEDMFVLTLKSGGKADFEVDGEKQEVNYKISGENIELSLDGESINGTIKDKVITLSVEGIELEFTKK